MQQLSRSWKGLMAAGLLAWTAACGGASQEGSTQGAGQGAALAEGSAPGMAPAGYAGSAAQRQAFATATANPLAPVVTESGFISLSVDGLGTNAASGVIQVNKPAGATVKAAYMAAASTGFTNYQIPNGGVKIDGQSVNWSRSIQSGITSWNHWADVTSLVSSKINAAPAGRVNFTITEGNTFNVDGEVLAVVFNNPASTTVNTVILLFGAQSTGGDTFRIGLAEPIDKSDPNLALDLSLGISFGYQDGSSSERQVSLIDVNGQRMTSQAGGQDDGAAEDGALITVGGLDDSNANPSPNAGGPGPHTDDELYDLRPFVANGATQITINTSNPSNDDNIFFGALSLTSAAAVIGEGIVLGPTTSTGPVGSTHTVTATLQDNNGQPLANRTVTFLVKTGPNAGLTGTAVTNAQGHASYTYTGNGGVGRDEIQASFVMTNGQTGTSNSAFQDWTSTNHPPVASCHDVVLEADSTCGATGDVNIDNGSSDPDGDEFSCVQSSDGPFGPGSTTVTLTCTDSSGASSSCSATVQVVDHTNPTISCPENQTAECANGGAAVDLGGALASDNCGAVNVSDTQLASYPLGESSVSYTATDSSGNTASCTTIVTVQDTQPPAIALNGPDFMTLACGDTFVDPGALATDSCAGDLSSAITVSGGVDTNHSGDYGIVYSVADGAGHAVSVTRTVTVGPCATCIDVSLRDYNLFLLGDYTGGHDIVGKVAAGGNITMTDFGVGSGLPANDTDNVLVAGGNLTLSRGGVYGDAHYGGTYSADQTVIFPRGSASQGSPIDFAAKATELQQLSMQLAGLAVNGSTTRESWGGIFLHGTDANLNVFSVDASAFTGAALFSIDAPAGSLVVVNITGTSATFTGFGTQFSGGIDQHGVLYNFTNTTSINAHGFGFWGTVLAPYADVTFTDGSWDGGMYAKSLSGNAEGHINPLNDHTVCPPEIMN